MGLNQFIEGSFLIAGGIFALVWAIQLFFAGNKTKIMSWILVIASIWLFAGAYAFTGIYLIYPYFYALHLPFVYLLGPLFFYHYKKNVLEENQNYLLLHIVPSIFVTACMIPYQTFSIEQKLDFLKSIIRKDLSNYAILIMLLNFGTKVSLLSYLGYILWENKNFIKNSKEISSKSKFLFLFITVLFFFILLLGLIGFILKSFFFIKLSALALPLVLYIFFLISSRYPEMFQGIQKEIKKGRYEQSKIKSLNVDSILSSIKIIMEEEKAFTDEDITLTRVAQELGISPHQLSQIINEKLNQSFPQFINEYRISEAKKMILEEKSRTVLSIAFAVGFNSKASFNRAFKQVTGITPQKFRKNYS